MKDETKESKPYVSIIVPIYNASSYLRDCLESLKAQSLDNIEIILVDDGSIDSSKMICMEYCNSDNRFKYFYQDNQGVSTARNLGLEKATGEYIGFCDSDDWIENNMYELMYESCNKYNVDFVLTDYAIEKDNKQILKVHNIPNGLYVGTEYFDYRNRALVDDYFEYPPHTSSWCILCRANIIKDNFIKYPNVTNGEDLFFGAKIVEVSNSMFYLGKKYLYHYRDTNGSASKNEYQKLKVSYLNLYPKFISEFKTSLEPNQYSQLRSLRYQLLFILLGHLLSEHYSIKYIYDQIDALLKDSVFRIYGDNSVDVDIKYSKSQKIQKKIIDNWDLTLIVILYLWLKKFHTRKY